jgi:hypothetical protein
MSLLSSFSMTRSLGVAAMLLCVSAAPALAQSSDSSTNSSAKWDASWSISAGADPFTTHFLSTEQNFIAAVGREWAKRGSRLGYRTQLAIGTQPHDFFLSTTCSGCFMRRRGFAEMSALATYTFRQNRRVQPYLIGGPALYGIRSTYVARQGVIGDGLSEASQTVWSLGATLGIGTRFTLFGKTFSLEQRLARPELSTASGRGLVVRPFTLSISF